MSRNVYLVTRIAKMRNHVTRYTLHDITIDMFRFAFFSLFFATLGAFFFVPVVRAEIPCAKIIPGQEVPAGYGAPYSVQSQIFPIMGGQCGESSITVEAGNWENSVYIYKYGYSWNSALKKWERFEFRGAHPSGEWFQGHASASLSRSLDGLRKDNHMLAYICEKVGSTWKCGCRDRACNTSSWQLQTYSIGDTPAAIFSVPVFPPVSEVLVSNLSVVSGAPGALLTISGGGFQAENTVWFGSHRIERVSPKSGSSITMSVPNIPLGRYEVFVENTYGKSTHPMPFVVSRAGSSPPYVNSISPLRARVGDIVTIYGKNFSPTNNSVFTGFEWIDGIPSKDGSSLSFETKLFSKYGNKNAGAFIRAASSTSSTEFPLVITVANEYGIATDGPILLLAL